MFLKNSISRFRLESEIQNLKSKIYFRLWRNPVDWTYWKKGVPGGSLTGDRNVESKLQLRRGGM